MLLVSVLIPIPIPVFDVAHFLKLISYAEKLIVKHKDEIRV